MKTISARNIAPSRWAIDDVLNRYIAWREQCYAVRLAYQRWTDSDREERRLAYAHYVAALDREERAARTYAERIELVRRISR